MGGFPFRCTLCIAAVLIYTAAIRCMKRWALVFDLDGTLVDSLPDLRAALNETLRGLGRHGLSPDEVRRMIGDNENDYSAARAAGVPVILMRYGYLRVPPETLAPDAWLDNFGDLPRTITKSFAARVAK